MLNTTERTDKLRKDLDDNVNKLHEQYGNDNSPHTMALLNDAINYKTIFEMTLGTLDEVNSL